MLNSQDLKAIENLLDKKLKPVNKKLNTLQEDMDLIAHSVDKDLTNTMNRVKIIENHLGLKNPYSI